MENWISEIQMRVHVKYSVTKSQNCWHYYIGVISPLVYSYHWFHAALELKLKWLCASALWSYFGVIMGPELIHKVKK